MNKLLNHDQTRTLRGLVEQYSPSGEEKGAVQWLVQRMQEMGFEQSFSDEAGNAIGLMGVGPRQIILLGHIDTVPGKLPVYQEGDTLYGRGAVDAKAPLAAFIEAVSQTGVVKGWQFMVVGAVDEERESRGARYLAPSYKPDYAIIGEPGGWERLTLGYKGCAWAQITLQQTAAHSASGRNSVCENILAIWQQIKDNADEFNQYQEKLFDQLTLSLRKMVSGEDGFMEWAQIDLMARLPMNITPDQWYECLNTLAASAIVKPIGTPIPAYRCEKNTPLVRAFLAAIRAEEGKPGFVNKMGTSDLNIVAPFWACPMLVYGPGDSALDHTPDECISLIEFQQSVRVLQQALSYLTQ